MASTGKDARDLFLKGSDVERAVKELISQAATVRVAVAYWGAGSVDRFGIKNVADKDVTIVCDLMSGACNPDEIELLQKALGKTRVLMRDRLHAKVWLTDQGAIVGSSNASANGLGFEGDELKGSIEANVSVEDAETLAAISLWFERDVIAGAKEITKPDLKEARRRWKRNRITRPLPPVNGSLLDVLTTNPAYFADRDFLVWVYNQGTRDRWANETLASEREGRKNDKIDAWQDVEGPVPPAGAYILDFDAKKNGRAILDGLWQVLQDDPLVKSKKGTLLLCKPANKFEGLSLGNRKLWEAAATRAAGDHSNREEWKIDEFVKTYF